VLQIFKEQNCIRKNWASPLNKIYLHQWSWRPTLSIYFLTMDL